MAPADNDNFDFLPPAGRSSTYSKPEVRQRIERWRHGDGKELKLASCGLRESDLLRLVLEERLEQLRSFDVSGNGFGDHGMSILAPALPEGLVELDLSANNIGVAGASELARQFANLKKLLKLDLGNNQFGDAGVAEMAARGFPANLSSLSLRGNLITREGIKALVGRLPASVTVLNLYANRLGDDGARTLARKMPRSLEELDLASNGIGAAGARAMAGCDRGVLNSWKRWLREKHWTSKAAGMIPDHLKTLNLSGNSIGTQGAAALAAALPSQLRSLNLANNDIDDAGATAMAVGLPRRLRALNLGGNEIGSAGFKTIFAHLPPTMEMLELRSSKISDEVLGRLKRLTRLQVLGLNDCAGLRDLSELKWLLPSEGGALRELRINGCDGLGLPEALLREVDPALLVMHLRSLQNAPGAPLLEMKVVVLGEGRVGKTDLTQRLLSDGKQVGTGESTHDFNIHEMSMPVPREGRAVPVKCRLFDFGGQPELHSTHQFFLQSRRVVYMLVLNRYKPHDDPCNRCEYWLRLIARQGKNSPVVIVCTHTDEGKSSKCSAEFLRQVAGDVGVNLIDVVDGYANKPAREFGNGYLNIPDQFDRVRQALQTAIASVSYIFDSHYPTGFFSLMKFVEGRAESGSFSGVNVPVGEYKYFAKKDFDAAARAIDDADNLTAGLREVWFRELRDLGCFHYVGDSRIVAQGRNPHNVGYYCFNPWWVKSPVYRIIRHMPRSNDLPPGMVQQDELRRFLREDAGQAARNPNRRDEIWGRTFDEDVDADLLIELMRACGLLYDLGEGRLMVPDHLFRDPASNATWDADEVRIPLKYTFLSDSVLLTFIGKWAHRLYGYNICKNRVEVLSSIPGNKARAVIRTDVMKRTVTIGLQAGNHDQRQELFLEVVKGLEEIEKSNNGGKVLDSSPTASTWVDKWYDAAMEYHPGFQDMRVIEQYGFIKDAAEYRDWHEKMDLPAVGTLESWKRLSSKRRGEINDLRRGLPPKAPRNDPEAGDSNDPSEPESEN